MLQKTENKFDRIYKEQTWSGKNPDIPLSGPGSLVESSLPVIEFIKQSIAQGEVSSILDLGCGDLTYMSTIEPIKSGAVDYTGTDISEFILQENRIRYSWFKGLTMDVTKPNEFDADLIVIKDLIFHLSNRQITALLNNLSKARFNYCIMTTMNNASNRWRFLSKKHNYADVNIRIAPFKLDETVKILPRDRSANTGKKDQGAFVVYDMNSFKAWTKKR